MVDRPGWGAGWVWRIRWDGELDGTLARELRPSRCRRESSGMDVRCLQSGMGAGWRGLRRFDSILREGGGRLRRTEGVVSI